MAVSVLDLFARASLHIARAQAEIVGAFRLTLDQYAVLRTVAEVPGQSRAGISEKTGIPLSRIEEDALADLKADGFIHCLDGEDRTVHPTDKGKIVAQDVRAKIEAYERALMARTAAPFLTNSLLHLIRALEAPAPKKKERRTDA